LSGSVGPYAQIPVTFICRTKKHDKKDGFTDSLAMIKPGSSQESRAGSTAVGFDEKFKKYFQVEPQEYATLAILSFSNFKHDDLKV
jgi:hypothetical protein